MMLMIMMRRCEGNRLRKGERVHEKMRWNEMQQKIVSMYGDMVEKQETRQTIQKMSNFFLLDRADAT